MNITLESTVRKMVIGLKEQAKLQNISLEEIRSVLKENVNHLDHLFQDDGTVRCEHFTDGATDYALQFGGFDSDPFENARWKAIESAIAAF